MYVVRGTMYAEWVHPIRGIRVKERYVPESRRIYVEYVDLHVIGDVDFWFTCTMYMYVHLKIRKKKHEVRHVHM